MANTKTNKSSNSKKTTTKKTTPKKESNDKVTPKKVTSKKKTTEKVVSSKVVDKDKKLEDTTRLRIDEERLLDAESLDTSFLEGRKGKIISNDTHKKEKILVEKKSHDGVIQFIKVLFYSLVIIALVILSISTLKKTDVEKDEDEEVVEEVKIDYNFVFVGDFHTKSLTFDDVSYPYVKVSEDDYTFLKIAENMTDKIYKYNPSHLFIQLGINDLKDGKNIDEILEKVEDIYNGISDNRPKAIICLVSLLPINSDIDGFNEDYKDISNDVIVELNDKIKDFSKSKSISYINVYNDFVDDGKLNSIYTLDGVHLNDDGSRKLFEILNGIVDEKYEEDK